MIVGALWEYVLDTPTDCLDKYDCCECRLENRSFGGQRLVFSCFRLLDRT